MHWTAEVFSKRGTVRCSSQRSTRGFSNTSGAQQPSRALWLAADWRAGLQGPKLDEPKAHAEEKQVSPKTRRNERQSQFAWCMIFRGSEAWFLEIDAPFSLLVPPLGAFLVLRSSVQRNSGNPKTLRISNDTMDQPRVSGHSIGANLNTG
jgi:hypothetical protein